MKLLAVSGGIDSMCMAEKALRSGCAFAVAHCNFALRGADSDADEEFVRGWCFRNSVRFHHIRFDTSGYAAANSLSTEMAARALRYDWFASLCSEFGYDAVCVAHNANDNAETLMLNLLRGTGSRGLRGMAVSHDYSTGELSVRVERPLLGITRAQIREWMTSNGCSWREDLSNSSSEYKRNRIRNEVFPVFEGINPSFIGTLNADMARFTEVDDIAEDYFRGCGLSLESGVELSVLLSFRHWKYLLYRLAEPFEVSSAALQSLCTAIEEGKFVPGRRYGQIVTTSGRLVLDRAGSLLNADCSIREGDGCMAVEGPGLYEFGGHRISISIESAEGANPRRSAGTLVADAAALPFPFLLRGWMNGDWMAPLGMPGRRKKLSDMFVDLKWSLVDKRGAVVAVSPQLNADGSGHVAALLCARIDDALKVTDLSSEMIVIKYL